jgi:hypothetical protein
MYKWRSREKYVGQVQKEKGLTEVRPVKDEEKETENLLSSA